MANKLMMILRKIFGSSSCLTIDQLILYIENKVPAHERFEVEKHLVDCELCSDAVEGLASSPDVGRLRNIMGSLDKELYRLYSKTSAKKQTRRIYYAIAAIIILGVMSVLYLFDRNELYESLFAEYYKPFPNTVPLVRGEEVENQLLLAMMAYEKGSYAEAQRQLQGLLTSEPENIVAHFYIGNTLLFLDKPDQAVSHFQNVIQQKDPKYLEHAEWYLGLAYLKMGKIEQAKSVFQQIISQNGMYGQQSSSLLDHLNP